VAEGEDRAQAVAVVADAARQWAGRAGASGVHVLFPREEEAQAWEGAGYLRREGFQFHWHRDGARTFDEYLGRFTSKQRNQIRREMRVVREHGIAIETLPPEGHSREIADV